MVLVGPLRAAGTTRTAGRRIAEEIISRVGNRGEYMLHSWLVSSRREVEDGLVRSQGDAVSPVQEKERLEVAVGGQRRGHR